MVTTPVIPMSAIRPMTREEHARWMELYLEWQLVRPNCRCMLEPELQELDRKGDGDGKRDEHETHGAGRRA